jgi:hypothetical protein
MCCLLNSINLNCCHLVNVLDMAFKGKFLKLERKISITADPGLSVCYLLAIKMRVVAEWITKFSQTLVYRRTALRRTRQAKSLHTGKDALVIGNGPSAAKLNWEVVAAEQKKGLQVFVINYFLFSEASDICTPNYIVLSDPITKPSVETNTRTQELWKKVRQIPSSTLVVPISWFPLMRDDLELSNRTLYFDDSGLEGWTKNIAPTKARGYLPLTAYKALAFAGYLTFNRISIIGIDNSMFRTVAVNIENRLIQYPNHFFERGAVVTDLSYFYPRGINDYFRDVSLCFGSLASFFGDLPIVNLDGESLVDCFPKDVSSHLLKIEGTQLV